MRVSQSAVSGGVFVQGLLQDAGSADAVGRCGPSGRSTSHLQHCNSAAGRPAAHEYTQIHTLQSAVKLGALAHVFAFITLAMCGNVKQVTGLSRTLRGC